MSYILRVTVLLALALVGAAGLAGEKQASETLGSKGASDAAARALIAKKFSSIKPEDILPTPVAGLYEVRLGSNSGFVTADGEYLIRGELFNLTSRVNLTQENRRQDRVAALASLDETKMIVFSPANPKHTITIFTDVDCSYCRKLHAEMAVLNELGIRVRYAAYPRSGPDSTAWKTMEAVWCDEDRRDAITRAKRGEPVTASCAVNPVAEQYAIGAKLGMSGTPGVYDEQGALLGGYIPAKELAALLDRNKTAAVAAATK